MAALITQDVFVNISISDLKVPDQIKNFEIFAYIGLDDQTIDSFILKTKHQL